MPAQFGGARRRPVGFEVCGAGNHPVGRGAEQPRDQRRVGERAGTDGHIEAVGDQVNLPSRKKAPALSKACPDESSSGTRPGDAPPSFIATVGTDGSAGSAARTGAGSESSPIAVEYAGRIPLRWGELFLVSLDT